MPTGKITLSSNRTLLEVKLTDGTNRVLTTPEGLSLVAEVKGGKVLR